MKSWDPNTNFRKEDIRTVPIWVHLEELELKYWGQRSLFKIIGQIGKPVMIDAVTKERERLNYPRILIEVSMNQELPATVEFGDENGCNVLVGVHYEWKPVTCGHCSGLGHTTEVCRKKNETRKEWIVKEDKRPARTEEKVDKEGFQQVIKKGKPRRTVEVQPTVTANTFQVLEEDEQGRKLLWKELQECFTTENWLLCGDFKDILTKDERIETYTTAEVLFLNEGTFDHSPGLLSLHLDMNTGEKTFKYFRMWKSHKDYERRVKEVWNLHYHGTKMYQLVCRLKELKKIFKDFNQEGYSDVHSAVLEARKSLEICQNSLRNDPLTADLQSKELDVRKEFMQRQEDYQSMLQQKSKITWIKHGNDNSSIFHASIKGRRRKNRILSIEQQDGTRIEETGKITDAFLAYYMDLLGSTLENRRKVQSKIMMLGPTVTQQQAEFLNGKFTYEEVKQEVFDIPGDLLRHYGRKANKPSCMIKLDLQKAYDTLEWGFLEEILVAFKFPPQFIHIVMNCVRTPKFSLMFNGALHGFFASKRAGYSLFAPVHEKKRWCDQNTCSLSAAGLNNAMNLLPIGWGGS
uniref:Reverse transcriptase domain-containing protein n=1 Tax=Cannabis sativa TaxID=3483 RepID=A0A803NMD7_CANSA